MIGPELQVAGPELRGAWDGYGAKLEQAGQDHVPFRHLAEEDHHPVAALDAEDPGRVREPVREDGDPGEVQAAFLGGFAHAEPDHGRPVLRGPAVHHVAPEGEPLRRLPVETRVGVGVKPDVRHGLSPFPKGSSPGSVFY